MHAKKTLIALIAFAFALAGCGKQSVHESAKKPAGPGGAAAPGQISSAQKQFLTIEPVGMSLTPDILALPGRVTFRPQAQSAIGATVAGRVVAVLVQPGQAVKTGTPLLTIESADAAAARATLDQAATRLAVAESVFRRQTEMMEKGVGLEVERQEAEARFREARTEHERARQAVTLIGTGQGFRVTVRAPSNGIVMSIRASAGATVAPGSEPLLELGDPSHLQVVAQVPESDLARVAIGQSAEVDLPALTTHVTAQVENFNPRIDTDSRRANVYFSLAKQVAGLRSGMLAQVALRVDTEKDITVPVAAVLIKNGARRVVYVERSDGIFEARDVQTGQNRNGRVVILQGLTAGEKVVVRGALLLDSQAELLL